jgi:hypothetical protein
MTRVNASAPNAWIYKPKLKRRGVVHGAVSQLEIGKEAHVPERSWVLWQKIKRLFLFHWSKLTTSAGWCLNESKI